MTLMKLESEALALEQLIFESGGEITPTLQSFIDEIDSKLCVKASAYKAVIDRFYNSAENMKKKRDQYATAAKSLENYAGSLEQRIKNFLVTTGKNDIGDDEITFKLAKSAPSLVINDKDLPDRFLIVETQYRPDREQIKLALKSGEVIPGVTEIPVVRLLQQIKKGK